MTSRPTPAATHAAAFEQPLAHAKRRADWLLGRYLANGGLVNALAFDRAAEQHQLAASREFVHRRLAGLAS